MTYRCAGCREYYRTEPYRRMGLSSLCSPECVTTTAGRRSRRPAASTPPSDIPADTRAAVLQRDGGCRFCGTRNGLHLHHINYRSQGVDHSETNLIVLCAKHHDLVHSNKRRWQPVMYAYIADIQEHGRKRYLPEIDGRLDTAQQ